MLLLEHKLIEIDYCKPVSNGCMIYMSGYIMNGKPVGKWTKYDNHGNIINIFDGSELSIYKMNKESSEKC